MFVNEYDFSMEKSKDGFNIIKIHKENKNIYIGSKYNMKNKIEDFVEPLNKESVQDNVFLIFGIGSGECLNALSMLYPKNKIVIYEPNIKLINYAKENPTQYIFLQKSNVYLINTENKKNYAGLSEVISQYEILKIIYKPILNYDKVYDKEFYEFTKIVKEFLSDVSINRNTNFYYSQTWFKTLINNLKYVINSTYINMYKNYYKDKPAIIVSAGPSLSKNIDELKNINEDMLIFSGGRTLKVLMEKNINPSLIGIVDPGEASYELVEGYIDKFNVPLLFYEGTNYDVVKDHNGDKILFAQSKIIDKIFNANIENLSLGGSIAHALTMAAILLGCNPIIFIGQDLAYTDERLHADIATIQLSNFDEKEFMKQGKIYIDDIYGKKVRTNEILDNFRRDLENIIKDNNDTLFIDATEGGAKIEGTTLMNLKEVIRKYKSNYNINPINGKSNKLNRGKIKESTIILLKDSINAGNFIKEKCDQALKILKELEKDIIRKNNFSINKNVKNLDNIDLDIRNKYENLEILNDLLYPIVYTIMSSYKAKDYKEMIQKNKFLYESILNIIEFSLEPMKKALLEIESMEI